MTTWTMIAGVLENEYIHFLGRLLYMPIHIMIKIYLQILCQKHAETRWCSHELTLQTLYHYPAIFQAHFWTSQERYHLCVLPLPQKQGKYAARWIQTQATVENNYHRTVIGEPYCTINFNTNTATLLCAELDGIELCLRTVTHIIVHASHSLVSKNYYYK